MAMDNNAGERNRNSVWMPLFFAVVLVLGMVIGFNLRDSLRNKRDISAIIQRNDRLEEIIDLIREKYVDTVNTNRLYKDAVSGILDPLDPHTIYIPADEVLSVNDELEGGFSGVGVSFSIVQDTVEVTSVSEEGPADKAGVASGDQLIKVGDSVVAGTHITSERIMGLLRGKLNTTVNVLVKSVKDNKNRQLSITRGIVPLYSLDASLMLDDRTGYVKINKFSATTYEEFKKALGQLKKEGATQLVVDLRDNPGGYLDAATSMADDLLEDERLIVYTRGRNTVRTDYNAKTDGAFEKGRVVILVNEGSASASEILAGAVQDWDRGVIIGRRTYGKGLVQEQYEMPDGAALRLTVARYYTPSGRSIQRSFAEGREAYNGDLEHRLRDGELTGAGSAGPADTTRYYTAGKRLVYGGGGIKPDVYVPYDTSHWSDPAAGRAYSDEMRSAIRSYFVRNRDKLRYSNVRTFIKSFANEGEVINIYVSMLPATEQKAVMHELATPANREYLGLHVKAQLARYLFHENGYYSVRLRDDNMVKKALAVINSNQYDALLSNQQLLTEKR